MGQRGTCGSLVLGSPDLGSPVLGSPVLGSADRVHGATGNNFWGETYLS